jgi:hypothetical protein
LDLTTRPIGELTRDEVLDNASLVGDPPPPGLQLRNDVPMSGNGWHGR